MVPKSIGLQHIQHIKLGQELILIKRNDLHLKNSKNLYVSQSEKTVTQHGGLPDRKQIFLVLTVFFPFQNKWSLSVSISICGNKTRVLQQTRLEMNDLGTREWIIEFFHAIQFHYDCSGWIMSRISQLLNLYSLWHISLIAGNRRI